MVVGWNTGGPSPLVSGLTATMCFMKYGLSAGSHWCTACWTLYLHSVCVEHWVSLVYGWINEWLQHTGSHSAVCLVAGCVCLNSGTLCVMVICVLLVLDGCWITAAGFHVGFGWLVEHWVSPMDQIAGHNKHDRVSQCMLAWTLGLMVLYLWCMAGTSHPEQWFSALAVFTFTSAQHNNFMHIQIQQPCCNLIQLSNTKTNLSCSNSTTTTSSRYEDLLWPPLLHILAPWPLLTPHHPHLEIFWLCTSASMIFDCVSLTRIIAVGMTIDYGNQWWLANTKNSLLVGNSSLLWWQEGNDCNNKRCSLWWGVDQFHDFC